MLANSGSRYTKSSEGQPFHDEASNPRQNECGRGGKQPSLGFLLGLSVHNEVDQKRDEASRQQPDRHGVYTKTHAYAESGYGPA